MLCVTGNEGDLASLAERLDQVERRLLGLDTGWLVEVRLDCLSAWDEGVFGLLARHRDRCLVCCRPRRQGGSFDGPEETRLGLLERAEAAQVAYLDVEADTEARFIDGRARERSALVLSWHDFEGIPADLPALLGRLRAHRPDVLKLAVTVSDAAELGPLLTFSDRLAENHVLIAMGEAGRFSRVRYPLFGSRWTYVAAQADGLTAPGQLTLDEALSMGLPGSASAPFAALVGGPQIGSSPGPRVYNRYFRARGLPHCYFGVITERAEETFGLLARAGALGASVTMPHKRAAFLAGKPDATAREVGSANTLRFGGPEVVCTNTDVAGVEEPLRRAGSLQPGAQALILGAGGAARAAAVACRALGLVPVVAARRFARAQQELSGLAEVIPWEARADCPARLLLNATPVAGTGESPWPDGRALHKDVVFDLALGGARSRLLAQAEQEGARAIHPHEMWLHQGARQLGFLLGRAVSADELRGYLT